jgi:tRNA U34 5-methylaminomethyl-2-thiouridine-forming methyltransferase MnmC
MPTTLKRHQITEVPELRAALDVARAAWPEETSTTKLIYRLASEGAKHLVCDEAVARQVRRDRIAALAGRHPSRLGPDYLEQLRQEWDR